MLYRAVGTLFGNKITKLQQYIMHIIKKCNSINYYLIFIDIRQKNIVRRQSH